MTLRYVYQRHPGEGDPRVIPWVRTTLGREKITLAVGIWCWVYVCEYGSVGRRSKEDRTRYEQNDRKKGTHTTVRSRITVAHNIRDQPYPMKDFFFVALGRIFTISTRLKAWCRFILRSPTLQQLYTAVQQYSCGADVYMIQDTKQTQGGPSK